MNRGDLQALSAVRLNEAKALLKAGFPSGAWYLAGYAVECGLKACIAKQVQRYDFPDRDLVRDLHIHDIAKLVGKAGLRDALNARIELDQAFNDNWTLVKSWVPESRYQVWRAEEARALLEAVGNRNYGAITWIKRHW